MSMSSAQGARPCSICIARTVRRNCGKTTGFRGRRRPASPRSWRSTSPRYVRHGSASMDEFETATKRAKRHAGEPAAMAARYDAARDRVVIALSTGDELAFAPRRAQGLETAKPSDLDVIEISPSGFGLHFPKLDADLWLPSLLDGVFGSPRGICAPGPARRGAV